MRDAASNGASPGAMGLADVAMYEGRYGDAEIILKASLPADQTTKNVEGAAAKLNALAEVYLAEKRVPLAVQMAGEALKLGRTPAVVVPAARTLVRAGREARA